MPTTFRAQIVSPGRLSRRSSCRASKGNREDKISYGPRNRIAMSSRPRKRATLPVAVVGLVSLVGFIFSRYLLINTKDSVVDQTEFLGSHTNPPEIYGHPSTGNGWPSFVVQTPRSPSRSGVRIEHRPKYLSR